MRPECTEDPPTPSSDIMWPGLESCSNLFTWGPCHQCWNLGVIEACMVGASGRCASYWYAFLFIYDFWDCQRKIFLCPVTHPTCQERYWYLPFISCILFCRSISCYFLSNGSRYSVAAGNKQNTYDGQFFSWPILQGQEAWPPYVLAPLLSGVLLRQVLNCRSISWSNLLVFIYLIFGKDFIMGTPF